MDPTDGSTAPALHSSSGGAKPRSGWGPLRLLPRLPLPGIPVPRLPLPGLRRAGGRKAAAAASLTLSSSASDSMAAPQTAAAVSGSGASANSLATTASLAAAPKAKPALKPASDVLAGALARALSQSTIHPLDTLKVRLQTRGAMAGTAAAPPAAPAAASVRGLSKFGQLVPPPGAGANLAAMGAGLASLYKGVVGAASGAGIAIGAYFACYGAACNLLVAHSSLSPSAVAFVSGGAAAAGSSVVKVPLAVCIRSVQAGVYPNVFAAARAITGTAGTRGLFTGFFPTLLEDVPDMAVKFAAYESMRQLHARMRGGTPASPQEDFAMGALAGALAAAATTPLDVIKTRMMCAAASRPTMAGAAREILAASGPRGFLAGIGPRALSNGINSAVFFCFFEAIRGSLQAHSRDGGSGLDAARSALAAWAACARERAEGIPRALSSLSLALPLADGGWRGAQQQQLGWATAGGGGSLEWMDGDDGGAAAQRGGGLRPLALALPVAGGSAAQDQQQLMMLADAKDAAGLAGGDERSFVGGGGSGLSLSLLARASPLRLDHHSQIAMAVAALKGVEAGGLPLEEE